MIDWIMDTSKGEEAEWQSVNHATVNSIGLETDLQLTVHRSKFKVSYSYIHQGKEQEVGIVSQYALEYLRHKLVVSAHLPLIKHLNLGLDYRWQDRVGSYTDFEGSVNHYKPYMVTDARLTWQQTKWKAYIEANNLFDVSYRDYGLVEQPGRWIIVGCSLRIP